MSARVVHNSVVHPPMDVRIFYKECRTLAAAGYDTHLVVPTPPRGCVDGVRFHRLDHQWRGRPRHLWSTLSQSWKAARALRPHVYHFHDPILIPLALLLKVVGCRVVYDVHEDYPREAFALAGARRWVGWLFWALYSALEGLARVFCDGFVCVTPTIARRFPAARTVLVQNFPLPEDLADAGGGGPMAERPRRVVYVGGLTAVRGAVEMVRAMEHPALGSATLTLAGEFGSAALREEMERRPGWGRVEYLGFQDRAGVRALLRGSRVGLVVLHPEQAHLDAQPIKLYEYMAAGLPVVASDFPLWRGIVEGAGCGVLVDPLDAAAVAEAAGWLLDHPEDATAMGERGRRAVLERFNWEAEAVTLVALYRRLGYAPAGG